VAELKLRLNLDAEEVELVVDGQVALSSGQDVFKSWVDAYNGKYPLEPVIVEKPVTVEVPVDPKVVEVNSEPDNAVPTVPEVPVDNAKEGE
jgi:hypothetical protein